jgi:hypothetical protein
MGERMTARRGTLAGLLGGLAVAAVAGCAPSEPESTPEPTIVASAQIPPLEVRVATVTPKRAEVKPTERVAAKPKPTPPAEETPAAEALATETPAIEVPEAEAPPVAYEPPFPHRTDLFVPPKRAGGAASGQNTGDNAVLLLGFVRVDQPKAVLSINGEIAPMAVGESRFGVDVISIAPPNVVLQRGRQRWQTTLE